VYGPPPTVYSPDESLSSCANSTGVREKEEFQPGEVVWVKDLRSWVTVIGKANSPRSFMVKSPRGEFRRNSHHLVSARTNILPESPVEVDFDLPSVTPAERPLVDPDPPDVNEKPLEARHQHLPDQDPPLRTTRSERHVRRPRRLIEDM
jgi:hypothetical protein